MLKIANNFAGSYITRRLELLRLEKSVSVVGWLISL